MEGIIVAIISAATAIVVALITYFASTTKMKHKMVGDHTRLSTEHNNLSRDIKDVDGSVKNVSLGIGEVGKSVSTVEKMLIEEKAKQELRYDNLNDAQRTIVSGIDTVKALGDEMKRLQSENIELRGQLNALARENSRLNKAIKNLRTKTPGQEREMDEPEL